VATIALAMIVKDEAHIIQRCLDSVKPLIDYVYIADTGSTDNTVGIVNKWMQRHSIPGKVVHHGWKNFASNRTRVLEEVRELSHIDYTLLIDADEILEYDYGVDLKEFKKHMSHDLYRICCRYGSVEYMRDNLLRNKLPYYFKGVLHEFLECAIPARNQAILKGVYNVPIQDSSRNMDPNKIRKDAEKLEDVIKEEKDPYMLARYTFYLGQSYRDCDMPKEAIRAYADRMKLGGWDQEKYVSLIQSAMLKEKLNYTAAEILNQLMEAREICPHRAEDLYRAAKYCYTHERPNMAISFIKQAMTIPHPVEGLFLEDWLWQFGMKDALMVCEYQLGNNKESLRLAKELLDAVPEKEKQRIKGNISYLEKVLLEGKQPDESAVRK
jgi:glycosyltransferase involved in cell wall biosynthesis